MPLHNAMVGVPGPTAPMSGYQQTASPTPDNSISGGVSGSLAIDGTPVRVATLAIVFAVGLIAFKKGGVKFNVTAG